MRILLVDDDETLMEALAQHLISQRYAVDIATDGEMGWEFVLLFDYDLIVLDLNLPRINGIDFCHRLRSESYNMPVIVLTASDRLPDKVAALDAGADDYIVKPFDLAELAARIRALLRRQQENSSPILQWQELTLDPKTREVKYQEQLLSLTPKESSLIELFLRHPQQVFSPGAIIDNIWSLEDPPSEEAVRTHIKGLRQKLKAVGMPKNTIQTVYGVGYRLKTISSEVKHELSDQNTEDRGQEFYRDQLRAIWLKFQVVAHERVAVIQSLIDCLAIQTHYSAQQTAARMAAHKLAGSLGSFGLSNGSRVAKQIEKLLERDRLDQTKLVELTQELNQELASGTLEHQVVPALLDQNVSLLIINHGNGPIETLVATAKYQGVKVSISHSLAQAVSDTPPDLLTAVLVKITIPQPEDLELLAQLRQQLPTLPIAVILERGELQDRLQVVRQGINLVLKSDLTPKAIVQAIVELQQRSGASAKVLIVDDDSQVLVALQLALKPWGFRVYTLEQPGQFWQMLEQTRPDLVVLDVEMPEINGIELCQILRSDPRWQALPVLFLTVHQDEKTQHLAFAIGADDYISKPVVPAELASRILNRLERTRLRT